MRVILILWACIVGSWQEPAAAHPSASTIFHLNIQNEHHSKPRIPIQENQEEEDDLTDEDEDFSDKPLSASGYTFNQTFFDQNQLDKFFLIGKTIGHINPIVPPHERLA
jgi:hypothetical protein